MNSIAEILKENRENSIVNTLRVKLSLWHRNYITRIQLRRLSDSELKDIGIDRSAAESEGKKPFWKS